MSSTIKPFGLVCVPGDGVVIETVIALWTRSHH